MELVVDDVIKWIALNVSGPVLFLVLLTGYRRIWVWGREIEEWRTRYSEMEEERDMFRELALRGTDIAERAVGHAVERKRNFDLTR